MDVTTVLGPIAPADLGFTLSHEHLICNNYEEAGTLDGVMNDEAVIAEEVLAFKAAGGRSMIDLTSRGQGRDPLAVKRIALATGVNVVLGCGWSRRPHAIEVVDRTSTNGLAAEMVADLTKGIDDTGVRSGIIGEIGSDGHITGAEERVLRAASRAHRQTGAAIFTHAIYLAQPLGLEQLDILGEEGADLRRVIVGHCDTFLNLDYHEAILRRGACVAYDGFGKAYIYPDERRVALIVELLRLGYAPQIVLSTDIGRRHYLHAAGGLGYDHLPLNVVPALRKAGAADEQVHLMTVANPARLLPF